VIVMVAPAKAEERCATDTAGRRDANARANGSAILQYLVDILVG